MSPEFWANAVGVAKTSDAEKSELMKNRAFRMPSVRARRVPNAQGEVSRPWADPPGALNPQAPSRGGTLPQGGRRPHISEDAVISGPYQT